MAFCVYVKLIIILNLTECVMTTITFDTHRFVRKLKEAGFEEKQLRFNGGYAGCYA